MLSSIVGPVDAYSAAVLIALIASICITFTTLVGKRRSRIEMDNELDLAKIKLADEKQVKFASMQNERDYKFKQLDQNLITSHARDEN